MPARRLRAAIRNCRPTRRRLCEIAPPLPLVTEPPSTIRCTSPADPDNEAPERHKAADCVSAYDPKTYRRMIRVSPHCLTQRSMLGSAAGRGERPEDIPTTSDRGTPMLRLVGYFPMLVAFSPGHSQRTRPRAWYSPDSITSNTPFARNAKGADVS